MSPLPHCTRAEAGVACPGNALQQSASLRDTRHKDTQPSVPFACTCACVCMCVRVCVLVCMCRSRGHQLRHSRRAHTVSAFMQNAPAFSWHLLRESRGRVLSRKSSDSGGWTESVQEPHRSRYSALCPDLRSLIPRRRLACQWQQHSWLCRGEMPAQLLPESGQQHSRDVRQERRDFESDILHDTVACRRTQRTEADSPPPRLHKVRKCHTIGRVAASGRPGNAVVAQWLAAARQRRRSDVALMPPDAVTSHLMRPPSRPTTAVELRTWQARRNSQAAAEAAGASVLCSGGGSEHGARAGTRSTHTQTLHVSKSLRSAHLSGSDVFVARVRAPPRASSSVVSSTVRRSPSAVSNAMIERVDGGVATDSLICDPLTATVARTTSTGALKDTLKAGHFIGGDTSLPDFARDAPSFSSFNSTCSECFSDDDFPTALDNTSAFSSTCTVHEAINRHVLLPVCDDSSSFMPPLPASKPPESPRISSGSFMSELLEHTGGGSQAPYDTSCRSSHGSLSRQFSSQFAAQMARQSSLQFDSDLCDHTGDADRMENESRTSMVAKHGDSALSSRCHDLTNICNDSERQPSTSGESVRTIASSENFNLVEETTDMARTVVHPGDEFGSVSSTSGDMADVGVSRLATPSTAGTTPPPSVSPSAVSDSCLTDATNTASSVAMSSHQPTTRHSVVVAIDFGTTYSGYAFSFTRQPDSVHIMRKAEGGDPGLYNQKIPTALLLTPDGKFSSFGFEARDCYHDLEPQEAAHWLFFDKFKLSLHRDTSLNVDTYIPAANGQCVSALVVFAHALSHFRSRTLSELADTGCGRVDTGDIRWVITVPAIWRQHAKQFMRHAAYQAGLCDRNSADSLLIALEPEVASVFCQSVSAHDLVTTVEDPLLDQHNRQQQQSASLTQLQGVCVNKGCRYLVVDCGGGTVDITVHEVLDSHKRRLKELYKASGGPYGSVGVDIQFEMLLTEIFGEDFILHFQQQRPASWIDLMVAFEARKRSVGCNMNASGSRTHYNINLPFSFISELKQHKNKKIESMVKNFGSPSIRYTDGVLRLQGDLMHRLFTPTLDKIVQQIERVVDAMKNLRFLFLVGGFSESKLLQNRIKKEFSHKLSIVIPQDVSLAILRGAVLYGIDPAVVQVRRSTMTYGVGVLNKFLHGLHPQNKLIVRDGREWCVDVFDKFVLVDQSVGVGETLLRRYTPAKQSQKHIVLHVYCTDKEKVKFITDEGVRRCATLRLSLDSTNLPAMKKREIQVKMYFGDTEVRASAVDVVSGKVVSCDIDFMQL